MKKIVFQFEKKFLSEKIESNRIKFFVLTKKSEIIFNFIINFKQIFQTLLLRMYERHFYRPNGCFKWLGNSRHLPFW